VFAPIVSEYAVPIKKRTVTKRLFTISLVIISKYLLFSKELTVAHFMANNQSSSPPTSDCTFSISWVSSTLKIRLKVSQISAMVTVKESMNAATRMIHNLICTGSNVLISGNNNKQPAAAKLQAKSITEVIKRIQKNPPKYNFISLLPPFQELVRAPGTGKTPGACCFDESLFLV
jgi:hypothetical protein